MNSHFNTIYNNCDKQVKSSQVAFNKNKWQSHAFYKHEEWKENG